jgi:predicted flavoprotein YhiN
LTQRLEKPQGRQTNSTFLRKAVGLSPVAISLIYEHFNHQRKTVPPPSQCAALIKSLPLTLKAPFPLERAISTAGGVQRQALNEQLMLLQYPGVFVAGEMLDWEAPTGGYLLQATFSTAQAAAHGMLRWLKGRHA